MGGILTENLDIKTIYENFIAEIPTNINIKLDILDIFSFEYFDEGYNPNDNDSLTITDIILTTLSTKLPNAASYGSTDSMIGEYIKLLKDFVINPNNLPSSLGNQLGYLLNESTSSVPERQAMLLPRQWISSSNDTYIPDIIVDLGFLSGYAPYYPPYYDYGYYGSEPAPAIGIDPIIQIFQMIPLFVPTDMDFVEPFEKGKDLMTTMGILTGNTIEDYLSDFGITSVTVLPKSAEILFDYGTMDETFVDSLGLLTQINNVLTNLYSIGIQIDSNSLSATGNARISYDSNGILSEFHVEATLEAETVSGSPLSVNIAFNIINGETDDGFTIPGYPLIYLILTISVVSLVIIQKTKKSLKKKV
jgi:hypothetical protein